MPAHILTSTAAKWIKVGKLLVPAVGNSNHNICKIRTNKYLQGIHYYHPLVNECLAKAYAIFGSAASWYK